MIFKKGTVFLGRGRVSSASILGDTAEIVVSGEGCLIGMKVKESGRQLFGKKIVSYGDDLFNLPFGTLERIGEQWIYDKKENTQSGA